MCIKKRNLLIPIRGIELKDISILNFAKSYDCPGESTSPVRAVFRALVVSRKMDEGLSRRPTADR